MKLLSEISTWAAALFIPLIGCAQQQVDHDFAPAMATPLYEKGKGPVLLIDGGHYNFHTLDDKFAPFGKVAEADGFVVRSHDGEITNSSLSVARILVIANALNEQNTDSWRQPVLPAFTPEEVEALRQWVWNGGRLFLIADHMPFPGAAADVAAAFGYTFYDGFALKGPDTKFDVFSYGNGMLKQTDLTTRHGKLDSLVSFTGQAFKIPDSATSVMAFDAAYKVLMPEEAWQFSRDMKMLPAVGLSQLAYSRYGAGKVVVAGEAAMFTAQHAGDIKFGLNSTLAPNNLPLLLNILEWLAE